MQQAEFPRIGEVFVDRYAIEDVIGAGGFSQVYRAKQTDLGRQVAIKVLKPVNDPTKTDTEREKKFAQVTKRFEREARLISRLKDRNTVVMYDYGTAAGGLLYMVLEYVDGITIAELLQTSGPLAPRRVVKILRQALTSLHEAHSMGVLHRDIKPGNIMVYDHVGRADQVKVLDFGIAKTVDRADGSSLTTTSSDVTADGVLVGTPRYMSPEQIRGKTLTAASDIYSLGLVAYEMLMGMKAVNADSSLRIIARHLDTDPIVLPEHLDLPVRLRAIVNKMLFKDPDDRFGTCNEVLEDLEFWDQEVRVPDAAEPTVTTDLSISQDAVHEADPASKSRRRVGILVAVAVLCVATVAAIGFVTQSGTTDPSASADTTDGQPTTVETEESQLVEPSIATVATAEPSPEPEEDDSEAAAATDAAATSVDAARTAATNQAPTAPDEADEAEEPDEKDKPAETKVVEAKVEPKKKTRDRPRPRRRRPPKKDRQKEEKPSKVDDESNEKWLFGIE